MIAVVTGHTKGIGKSLADYFSARDYQIFGFSTSNGYNIGDGSIRDKIVELSEGADVFVNNAYDFKNQLYNAQNDLLLKIFGRWRNKPRTIINVSSIAGDYWPTRADLYARNKYEIDETMVKLDSMPNQLQLINLRPGYVYTEQASKVIPSNTPAMQPNDVFNLLDFVLDKNNKFRVTSISYKVSK